MATNTETVQHTDIDYISLLRRISRNERAQIADDTLQILKAGLYQPSRGSPVQLTEDIEFSMNHSLLYTDDDLNQTRRIFATTDETNSITSCTQIEVRHCTTLQAAQFLAADMGEDRVGILNFASAKNPGGGFIRGSNAQEESIARSSSLYSCLIQPQFWNNYYDYHRRGKSGIYSHRMIYSPRVIIFKDDNGELLPLPYRVGIVTAPAPNASVCRDPEAIRNALNERIRRILCIFETQQHDTLVLGAFGCGVFKNNPFDVAMIFREYLATDRLKKSFKRVIFAVLDRHMYETFEQVFTNPDLEPTAKAMSQNKTNTTAPIQTHRQRRNQHKAVAKERRQYNTLQYLQSNADEE